MSYHDKNYFSMLITAIPFKIPSILFATSESVITESFSFISVVILTALSYESGYNPLFDSKKTNLRIQIPHTKEFVYHG